MPKSEPIISLNLNEFATFYDKLSSAYDRYVVMGLTMSSWVNSKGDGFFTWGLANGARGLIRNVIAGKKNIGQNWEPPSKEHADSWSALGGRGKPWYFQGNVRSNIVARKLGKGYEVGIDRRATVKRVGFSTMADFRQSKTPTIKVETYAAFVEYGTQWMDARPLFSLVYRNVATQMGPGMEKVARDAFKRVAKMRAVDRVRGKTVTAGFSDTVGAETLRQANPDDNFRALTEKDFAMNAHLAGEVTGFVGKAGLNKAVKQERNESSRSAAQFLARATGSQRSEAEEWLKNNPEFNLEGDDL